MLGAILILFAIPFIDRSPIRTPRVRSLLTFGFDYLWPISFF